MKTKLPLTAADVEFEIFCDPEETPIEGNGFDLETENWIKSELDRGNYWAWCTVRVAARWSPPGKPASFFQGFATLSCSSYDSEMAFRVDGYFSDMKQAALDDLNKNIRKHYLTRAAPDLLEALIEGLNPGTSARTWEAMARAAIAKATGEVK